MSHPVHLASQALLISQQCGVGCFLVATGTRINYFGVACRQPLAVVYAYAQGAHVGVLDAWIKLASLLSWHYVCC